MSFLPFTIGNLHMATLPQPEITVAETDGDTGSKRYAVTATRDGKSRTWSGEGVTATGAIKEVVDKMLGDHHTGEFVKRG